MLTCSGLGLVADNAHCASVHACKPNDNVFGIVGHDFKEGSFIHNAMHHIQHVICSGGLQGNDGVQTRDITIPVNRNRNCGTTEEETATKRKKEDRRDSKVVQ